MLIIVDPSLRSFSGHFLTYDRVISDELKKRGETTTVLAAQSASVSLMPDFRVVPSFRYGLEEPRRQKEIVSEAFFIDLDDGASRIPGSHAATYFLHTCTAAQIEPSVRFIAQPRYKTSRLIILLRYSITINPLNPDMSTVEAYSAALKSIEQHGVADRVFLVTDSDLLADEYSTITQLPITVLPIPHVGLGEQEPETIPTLTYLGNARSSKGFEYLPFLISQLRPELANGEWRAEIQANVMFNTDVDSVTALMALRNEPVTLHESELSLRDYEALLHRSSLIVIPYWTLWYHSQTSGVFAEAVGAGRPVIVPRGTWMAEQLGRRPAGKTFFPGDRIDLVRATREAMRELSELMAGAAAFREQWRRKHSPAEFVRQLLALGGQG